VQLSRKGDLAKAINYMLSRWASFARFVSDGRICMTNNSVLSKVEGAAERRVRTVAVGRRNWTFCGSDCGGYRAAAMYTLIQTCRLNDVDPHAWLRDVIARISDHPKTRLHELLPWNGKLDSSVPKPSRKQRSITRAKLEGAHRTHTFSKPEPSLSAVARRGVSVPASAWTRSRASSAARRATTR
jgi:hypothetical protein